MDFCVYIIQSSVHKRFYTGMSSNLENRLAKHNSGLNTSTRTGAPWHLIWNSEFLSKTEASELERKIKKRGAARYLNDITST
ncbi:MAG: GIY-YIG nuclease family protein [Cryomorphaceae bacterium]